MRRALRGGIGAALLAIVVSAMASGSAVAAPPSECDSASVAFRTRSDLLITAGELAPARSFVSAAVKKEPSACVGVLLQQITDAQARAQKLLQEALDAKSTGDTTTAATRFVDALGADHSLTAARTGLEALIAPTATAQEPFAAAERLAQAGFVKEARDAAIKALQENQAADPTKVPEKARPASTHWWLTDWVDHVPVVVRETLRPANLGVLLAILAGTLLFVVVVLKNCAPPRDNGGKLPTVARGALKVPGLKATLLPVVTFTNDESAATTKVSATLRDDVMARLTRDDQVGLLSRSAGADLADIIGDLTLKLPGWSAIGKLVPRALARRTITVALTLGPQTDCQVSAVLSVTDWRGHTFDACRFSEPVATVPGETADAVVRTANAAYGRLARGMAPWLAFALWRLWNPSGRRPLFSATNDWRSYQEILIASESTSDAEARAAYQRALRFDACNEEARIMLAARLKGDVDGFRLVKTLLAADSFQRSERNDIWPQRCYILAVAYLVKEGRSTYSDAEHARQEAAKCIQWLTLMRDKPNVDERRKQFARTNLPTVEMLLLSCIVERLAVPLMTHGRPSVAADKAVAARALVRSLMPAEVRRKADEVLVNSELVWTASYNRACLYARVLDRLSDDDPYAELLQTEAIRALRFALVSDSKLVAFARDKDAALQPLKTKTADAWAKLFAELESPPAPAGAAWTVSVAR